MSDFEQALKHLPEGTYFDSFAHNTVEDLCHVCLHELDLHAEGEYRVSLPLRKKYLKFIQKYGNEYYKNESTKIYNLGLKTQEWVIDESV